MWKRAQSFIRFIVISAKDVIKIKKIPKGFFTTARKQSVPQVKGLNLAQNTVLTLYLWALSAIISETYAVISFCFCKFVETYICQEILHLCFFKSNNTHRQQALDQFVWKVLRWQNTKCRPVDKCTLKTKIHTEFEKVHFKCYYTTIHKCIQLVDTCEW